MGLLSVQTYGLIVNYHECGGCSTTVSVILKLMTTLGPLLVDVAVRL